MNTIKNHIGINIFSKAILMMILLYSFMTISARNLKVESPNGKISVQVFNGNNTENAKWFLKVNYFNDGKITEAISSIDLGLILSDGISFTDMKFLKSSKPLLIKENYTMPHGKSLQRHNTGNEVVFTFENKEKKKLDVIIRVYNDGIAFRYSLSGKGNFTVQDELTSYSINQEITRWTEKWNPANEGLYASMVGKKIQQEEWCYPALFQTKDNSCWFLLHESAVDGSYFGSKLSNKEDKNKYKITFPDPKDGRGKGESLPKISLPWKSPWRVIIIGNLNDIVASTLVDDVAPPSVIKNTDWIKPGAVSWNYWSSNHGTKDFKTVCAFADLAVAMDWPYTLLDWEWDSMGNGGNLEDALKYIHSNGIKPLMWYNSGGDHTWVSSTPKDRMLTHENRVEEFTKLKKLGVAGVKVDFFESEKQDMIQYYLDILEDAAQFEMMVYFHGCLVPRGWARTYPNLMTYEAVRGAEWYNNGPEFTATAPVHNTILPFTRNVVGSMDYTPVTFTNSQFPHLTSYGHELALSVIFESALQHFADRPEGYYELPDEPKKFLREVPTSWDETRLLQGFPGKDVVMARRKNNVWYVGGINGENIEKNINLKFDFLDKHNKYKLRLIKDGKHDKQFLTNDSVIESTDSVDVKLLRRGGFAAVISPL
ncbi:glycoside hydrolase family 97 catalytic domain-containing protein [Chryseobacterium zhengzhouense]|uniref:Glycoside hydrolase family 97 catalytic domain-containing protein n=1 Tax=Chryseobacterium zhengzhouense TaxID=1636086 RepID=A0ABW2LSZ5_9FLAO